MGRISGGAAALACCAIALFACGGASALAAETHQDGDQSLELRASLAAFLGPRAAPATTAFDLAPTGVAGARARHPGAPVDWVVADLLAAPPAWERGFELVVEAYTVSRLRIRGRTRRRAE